MRKARVTWKGAMHHVMNRGLNKQKIFISGDLKKKYIILLSEKSRKYNIKIFAYCVMDNHFHICLENTSGNLSEFMKSLNGHYGQYFRHMTNSKGYVFEDRFKSTLIQDENYLITLVLYILLNPIRSGYVRNPFDYKWSSTREYFKVSRGQFIDKELIETTFSTQSSFKNALIKNIKTTLSEDRLGYDRIFGDADFMSNIKNNLIKSAGLMMEENAFKEVLITKIISDFEEDNKINISNIDTFKVTEKKLRDKLLVMLMDSKSLSYKDIKKIDVFKKIKIETLRTIYYRKKMN